MYFSKFPKIFYEFDIGNQTVLKPVTDITTNVRFRKQILSNITLYDLYDIKDGETPEILADRVYGSSQYHWVIMLANDRYDYVRDWPMHSDVLDQYIASKYTPQQYDEPHHWEKDGYIVDPDVVGSYPVSNWQHEVRNNDLKRRIKLVNSALVKQVLKDFSALV
jgi:hypothetical protein